MARIDVAEFCSGAHLTRADGARLRAEIEGHWNDSDPVCLDFKGLRIASVSFFDESLGLLALKHALDELARRVRIENINPPDRELLNKIVSTRAKERDEASASRVGSVR